MRPAIVFTMLVLAAAPAAAQTRPVPRRPAAISDRVFVSIDGVFQSTANDFSDSATFQKNAETGSFSTKYNVQSGPAFNVAGGARLAPGFAVAVGVSRFSHSTPTALTAAVPHPFFFNQPRTVNGDIVGVTRQELAVHVQARGMIPLSDSLTAMLFAGPSFFQVKQDVVNDFSYTDAYPYDTASFTQGVMTTAKKSKVGFNAGADVSYFFGRQVGVGGTVQYARSTITLDSAGGGALDVKVGGFQAGGGVRLRF